MAARFAVNTTPAQLTWTDHNGLTVVNVDSVPVFIDDDSSVSVTTSAALLPGASMYVAPGVYVWGVVSSGTATIQLLYDNDQWQQPSRTPGVLLAQSTSEFNNGTIKVTPTTGILGGVTSPSLTVVVYFTAAATVASGVWSFDMSQSGQPYMATLAPFQKGSAAIVGIGYFGVTFPWDNPQASVSVTRPSGVTAGSWGVYLYATPESVDGVSPWFNGSSLSVAALSTDAALWRSAGSNVWTAYVGSIAATTTTTQTFPAYSGPTRVVVEYTQVGAGSVSCVLQMYVLTGSFPTNAWVQFDTLASTSAAGTVYASNSYAVWPTTVMRVQFVTTGAATVTGATLSFVASQQ